VRRTPQPWPLSWPGTNTPTGLPVARPNPSVMAETLDVYIWVSNVDDLATELRAKGAQIKGPIDRIYAMRELIVRDCNGYVLAFGQG
jgi:hypothetical protein